MTERSGWCSIVRDSLAGTWLSYSYHSLESKLSSSFSFGIPLTKDAAFSTLKAAQVGRHKLENGYSGG